MFRHHPDGIVYIGSLVLPLAEFLIDAPGYSLPAGATGRLYEPGVRHVLSDGKTQWAGPMPWPEGDSWIAAEDALRSSWEARQPPPSPDLTDDEVYDLTIQNQRVLKALVLCINDGSIVPGANASAADLKAAIKAKM